MQVNNYCFTDVVHKLTSVTVRDSKLPERSKSHYTGVNNNVLIDGTRARGSGDSNHCGGFGKQGT